MKNLTKQLRQRLKCLSDFIKGEIDMMIKLYAINVAAGIYPFNRVPKVLRSRVKEQVALMLEDDALVEELTKE